LQGIAKIVGDSVMCADAPEDFANNIIALLANSEQRSSIAKEALDCIRTRFSPEKSFQGVQEFIVSINKF
jgi:glycosyltransferase involved in cell wall biosynthesis